MIRKDENNEWHLYKILCKDGSLYTGITTDIDRRFTEHLEQGRKCAKYLRGKTPLKLVYVRIFGSRQEAYSAEFAMKILLKSAKEHLIAS